MMKANFQEETLETGLGHIPLGDKGLEMCKQRVFPPVWMV